MKLTREHVGIRRIAGITKGRIFGARWTLGACGLAIGVIAWRAGAAPLASIAAFLLVVIVTAAAPRSRARLDRATGNQASRETISLSASDLIAALPDPVLILDKNGSLVEANQAAVGVFGTMPPGTLLQLRFRASEMQKLIADAIAERRWSTIEHVEKGPIERVFKVSVAPAGSDTNLFVMHFRDQSETRRIDRMRADFIANASHELRTPLASVAGFVETLRGPARDDPKARDEFLEIMQAQTARMARLIDDLLSLSRIEMKPYVRGEERIDLALLVSSVADALQHLAGESGIRISIEHTELPLLVPGSRDELIQVFENLLENACKYGQSGGRVDVQFAHSEEGARREAVVTIRDYGPGIAEEHIPRITERFYRVDVETSRAQKGTGLGLSIVKHILTRHDGRLVVKSKLGEGSAFSVHLPLD